MKFSSQYQPAGHRKSLGWKKFNIRKQMLIEALGINKDVSSVTWNNLIENIRYELTKKDNMEMILKIIDKLAPRDMVEHQQEEPIRLMLTQEASSTSSI